MKAESVKYDEVFEEDMSENEENGKKANFFVWYLNEEVMHGNSASSGMVTGRAAVITKDEDMLKVKNGAVIICKTASPCLIDVLAKTKAIVAENGGQAALVMGAARVYGIPAVAGIPGLTEKISDGDIVRVDGTNGDIIIKKRMVLQQLK